MDGILGGYKMELVIALVLGYVLGMCTKGFQIHIDRKKPSEKQEYNKSTYAQLPDDVREYAEKHNGYIRT